MSHFAVAVFSDDCDFDGLLAPYSEVNDAYKVFIPVAYEKIVSDFERFKKNNRRWTLDMYIENFNYIQRNGEWGYMSNPQGYYDWYSLDGKEYLYDLKPDAELDENEVYYRKNDYVWYYNDTEAETDAIDFWDSFVGEGAIAAPPGIWNRKYFLNRYKTKEQYVKEQKRTIPWAFITPDGVWHSAGKCGWFGMSDETAEDADRYAKEWDEFIASDANPHVSLVDCHV